MAKKPSSISRQINNRYGGNRNYNGANDNASRRQVTKRGKSDTTLSGIRLKEGRLQFGTRSQREYDLRSAFANARFSDGTLEAAGKAYTVG